MKKLNKKLSIFSLLIAMAIALMTAVLLINPATAYANSEFSAQNVEKVAMVNGASLRLNAIDDAHRGIRFEGYVNEAWYEENGAQAGMLLYKGETTEKLTVDTEGVAKVNQTIPSYKHINLVEMRLEEFEKNPSKKIKRFLLK